MSEKALKTLVALLGGLVVVYAVVLVAGGGEEAATPDQAVASFFADVGPDSVAAVTLWDPDTEGEPARLEGSGGRWTVNGQVADSALVMRLWTALEEAEVGETVSRNPANHTRMEIDDARAGRLVLARGASADTLLVGKSTGAGGVYVRLPGRDEVHTLDADLASHVRRAASEWRSKRIVRVDTARVQEIELARDGETFTLARSDDGWTADGEAVDTAAVRRLMMELAALRASGFWSPSDEAKGDEADADPEGGPSPLPEGDPDRTATARDADGETLVFLRLWEPAEEAGSGMRVTAEGPGATAPGTVYTYTSWRADRLVPTREELTEGG